MSDDTRPPRKRPRRSYPPHAYIPFALLAAIPTLVLIAIIAVVVHLLTPPSHPVAAPVPPTATHAPHVTPTRFVAVGALGTVAATRAVPRITATPTKGAAAAGTVTLVKATPIITVAPPRATVTVRSPSTATPPPLAATAPVTVALGANADGSPLTPSTTIHGAHDRLWAFATVPNVHAGDTIHFVWRDLSRRALLEDWPDPVQVNAASYAARMYAFLGSSPAPTRPFPPGHYRVDVYRNATLVGSRAFSVAAQ